jgi:hypothetical protein
MKSARLCQKSADFSQYHLFLFEENDMKAIVTAAAIAALFATSTASAEFFGDDSNMNTYSDGYGYGYGDGSGRGRGSGEFDFNMSGKADADMDTDFRGDAYGAGDGRFYNYNTPYGSGPYGRPYGYGAPAPMAPYGYGAPAPMPPAPYGYGAPAPMPQQAPAPMPQAPAAK